MFGLIFCFFLNLNFFIWLIFWSGDFYFIKVFIFEDIVFGILKGFVLGLLVIVVRIFFFFWLFFVILESFIDMRVEILFFELLLDEVELKSFGDLILVLGFSFFFFIFI